MDPGRAAAPRMLGLLAAAAVAAMGLAAAVAAEKKPVFPKDPGLYAGSEDCAACHDQEHAAYLRSPHAVTLSGGAAYPAWLSGCESCHGPGKAHVEAGGGKGTMRSFTDAAPAERVEVCLQCHGGQDERINFRRSEHANADVSCDACHSPHGEPTTRALLRKPPTDLCLSCHGEIRTSFAMPFHHKVLEGSMTCVACHNQHGGFAAQQRIVGTDVSCLKCHSDKQGPFTFEHLALRLEGCATCHLPHGSSNPRLLTRSEVRFQCLECHSGIEGTFGVGTPSFHNLNNARYFSCTTCHVMIHGSNLNDKFFE